MRRGGGGGGGWRSARKQCTKETVMKDNKGRGGDEIETEAGRRTEKKQKEGAENEKGTSVDAAAEGRQRRI